MKRLMSIAIFIAILGAACGSQKETPRGEVGATGAPIKIGVVGPMTGQAAFVGKNMVEGIQLAVESINGSGGLLGGRQVSFVVRDDEGDPAKTTTAVRELVQKEHVSALFGPTGSSNYLSIARFVTDSQVPTWVITSGPELTEHVNPYAFRAYLPDSAEIGPLASYAAKHYHKVAILASNDADGVAFAAATKSALQQAGSPAVTSQFFTLDETDFSPLALKVKQSGADALILGSHLGLFASRFAVAARNLDYNVQILGVAGLINYTYPDLARAAADGTIFVSFRSWSHLPRTQWPASVRDFYEAYVSRYLPQGEFSETGAYKAYSTNFLTYDMVKIWSAAVKRANSADPVKVDQTLNNGFTYPASDSVIGAEWRYSATNHDGIREGDLYFYRWELQPGGKFKLHFVGTTTDVLSGKVAI